LIIASTLLAAAETPETDRGGEADGELAAAVGELGAGRGGCAGRVGWVADGRVAPPRDEDAVLARQAVSGSANGWHVEVLDLLAAASVLAESD